MAIAVLIADDEPGVRTALARLLSSQDDFMLVGEASDGEEAVRLGKETAADVIVMDHKMPKLSGLDATKRLRKLGVGTPVLIFTSDETVSSMIKGLNNVHFLSKGKAGARETLQALRDIAPGA